MYRLKFSIAFKYNETVIHCNNDTERCFVMRKMSSDQYYKCKHFVVYHSFDTVDANQVLFILKQQYN